MQGIVTDENGAYVKAAIVKVYKFKDTDDEADSTAVTYAETNEEGDFIIRELDPDEKYMIEVHVGAPEPKAEAEPESKAGPEPEQKAGPEPEQKTETELKAENEPESQIAAAKAEDYEEDDYDADDPYIDLDDAPVMAVEAETGSIDYTVTENISIGCCSYYQGFYLKDKPYLVKSNIW